MKTSPMFFESHPLLGFILSSTLVFLGFGVGGDLHLQIAQTHSNGLPEMIKDIFQCVAWLGAGATGFVAAHGFWIKNVGPHILKWKQNRKSRKK